MLARIGSYLSLIKFSHTVFALPFALLSAVLAASGAPPTRTLLWILAAMVGARSAAMSFNRIVDRRIDSANPRTRAREIPAGVVSLRGAWILCLSAIAVFLYAAWRLNGLCFALAPLALLIVLGYSLTKRWTALSHLVLGLALAIAPVGAWLAVTGRFAIVPVLLGLGVLFWVAGFDVLYGLQDRDFDRAWGLRSIPVALGTRGALWVARLFHALTLSLFAGVVLAAGGGPLFGVGVAIAAIFLVRQHALLSGGDLRHIDAAFFTANGWLSVAFFVFGALDVLLRTPAAR